MVPSRAHIQAPLQAQVHRALPRFRGQLRALWMPLANSAPLPAALPEGHGLERLPSLMPCCPGMGHGPALFPMEAGVEQALLRDGKVGLF